MKKEEIIIDEVNKLESWTIILGMKRIGTMTMMTIMIGTEVCIE